MTGGSSDQGYLSSNDGTRLFWRAHEPAGEPSAWVLVVHGFWDHSGRFQGTMEALADAGLACLAIDLRGHGKADGPRGDVTVFSHFVDDVDAAWRKLRALAHARPAFVLAHSHGALVAIHWQALHPVGLGGLVLTSPYLKLPREPHPVTLAAARILARVMPGMPLRRPLDVAQVSRDEAWQRATAGDPLYGAVYTPRWLFLHRTAQAAVWDLAPGLTAPLLMLTAGEDTVVSTPTARSFFEQSGSTDKTYTEYPGMRHEVLNEIGKERVIGEIARWISAHS